MIRTTVTAFVAMATITTFYTQASVAGGFISSRLLSDTIQVMDKGADDYGGLSSDEVTINPQPIPPREGRSLGRTKNIVIAAGDEAGLNPQPLPPKSKKRGFASVNDIGESDTDDGDSPSVELNMLEIQSIVSQRQMAVQLATSLLNQVECKECILNIR